MATGIFDTTVNFLGKVMDLRADRHHVIASNVANKDTPRYKAKEIVFEDALKRAVRNSGPGTMLRTHRRHFPSAAQGGVEGVTAAVRETEPETIGQDLNTVEIEKEMVGMAANTILYDAATKFLNKKLSMIKYAIMSQER